ncbi:MAG: hypothetical protein HYX32_14075 [Actinobacteria bacterium]|nr:hypothetical protein [Actinomycetota bacterium]
MFPPVFEPQPKPLHDPVTTRVKRRKPRNQMTLNCIPDGSADELLCVPMR